MSQADGATLEEENYALAGRVEELEALVNKYEAALRWIRDTSHQSYDDARPYSSDNDMQYKLGIADGHRCAAQVARNALGEKP